MSFSKYTILSSHPFETIFSDVWTHLSSPYETIFGTAPNYSKLQILDCLCYPWLPPYTTHKLDSCFKPCVFIGYYLTQSAYYCLDPSTSKIYVSRHVKFVESSFPFIHLSPTSPRPQPNYVATWFPKPLVVSSTTLLSPLHHAPQQLSCEAPVISFMPITSNTTNSLDIVPPIS